MLIEVNCHDSGLYFCVLSFQKFMKYNCMKYNWVTFYSIVFSLTLGKCQIRSSHIFGPIFG